MPGQKSRKALDEAKFHRATLALQERLMERSEKAGEQLADLLQEISRTLRDLFQCATVEIILQHGHAYRRYGSRQENSLPLSEPSPDNWLGRLSRQLIQGHPVEGLHKCMAADALILSDVRVEAGHCPILHGFDPHCRSLAMTALGGSQKGVLFLASTTKGAFFPEEAPFIRHFARTAGLYLSIHHQQEALVERVKELTCLYGLSQLEQQRDMTNAELLKGVADLIPPAWQYPESAHCRITIDEEVFESRDLRQYSSRRPKRLTPRLSESADIVVQGQYRGRIEVFYDETLTLQDQQKPFLAEECLLLRGVAQEVATIMERRQLEKDREKLREQIRHLDRLASIGQIVAEVAHELSEPLCGILGIAQLVVKDPGLPKLARKDLEKIVNSSLQAREVVKNLLQFSRSEPARKSPISLNQVITKALDLFSARCAEVGIPTRLALDPSIPQISADANQIHQVLVNLITNALHAMPKGGTLILESRQEGDVVAFSVTDSGIGMSEEIMENIFVPFFTTKDARHGTGLGLGIVQNIITAHGGTISVHSSPGGGACFTVQLPLDSSTS